MVASPRLMSLTYNLACFRTTSPMALNGFLASAVAAPAAGNANGLAWARRLFRSAGCPATIQASVRPVFLSRETASGALLKNSPCNCARPLS